MKKSHIITLLLMLSSMLFAQQQDYVDAMTYSGNGMLVQKYRLRIIAENLANVVTHMTDTGLPYRKKIPMVVKDDQGVHIQGVVESNAPFGKVYDPSHVYSKDGYLLLPNFEANDEIVNLSYTNLAYEANTTVFKSSRQMYINTLELLK